MRGSDLGAGLEAVFGAGLGAGALTAGFFLGAPAPMVGGSETRGGRFSAAPPAERRRVEVFFLPPLAEEEEEEESEVVRLGRGREVIRVLRDLRVAGGRVCRREHPGAGANPGRTDPVLEIDRSGRAGSIQQRPTGQHFRVWKAGRGLVLLEHPCRPAGLTST